MGRLDSLDSSNKKMHEEITHVRHKLDSAVSELGTRLKALEDRLMLQTRPQSHVRALIDGNADYQIPQGYRLTPIRPSTTQVYVERENVDHFWKATQ